jgi:hypothetical protein
MKSIEYYKLIQNNKNLLIYIDILQTKSVKVVIAIIHKNKKKIKIYIC